jgi:phosphoribosylcarboxyaminoimidazole (NCAIR) mutase
LDRFGIPFEIEVMSAHRKPARVAGGSKNAAVLAAQIIATGDDSLRARLVDYKKELSEGLKL